MTRAYLRSFFGAPFLSSLRAEGARATPEPRRSIGQQRRRAWVTGGPSCCEAVRGYEIAYRRGRGGVSGNVGGPRGTGGRGAVLGGGSAPGEIFSFFCPRARANRNQALRTRQQPDQHPRTTLP